MFVSILCVCLNSLADVARVLPMHEATTNFPLANEELTAIFHALVQAKNELLDTARAQIQAKDELLEAAQKEIQGMFECIESLSSELEAKSEESLYYQGLHVASEEKVTLGMQERLAEMKKAADKLASTECDLDKAIDAFNILVAYTLLISS